MFLMSPDFIWFLIAASGAISGFHPTADFRIRDKKRDAIKITSLY